MTASGRTRSRARPPNAPRADTVDEGQRRRRRTPTPGLWYLAARLAVRIWVRSPNSPTRMTTKARPGHRPDRSADASASSSPSCLLVLLGDEQEVDRAAGEEHGDDRLDGQRWGRSCEEPAGGHGHGGSGRRRPPPAPIQTSSGRYRLPMIRVAIIVLSGSSATTIRAKTVATMPRFTLGWTAPGGTRAHGSGRRPDSRR